MDVKLEESRIKIMKESNRLRLTNWQLFWHYSVVMFIMLVPVLNLYAVFEIEVTGTYTVVRSSRELLIVGLPWLIPALIFGIIKYRRLNFSRLAVKLTAEEFVHIVEKAVQEMNWSLNGLTKDYAVAISGFNWVTRGERITIIRKENEILINSICVPDAISIWKNKRNIKLLKNRLKRVL